MPRLQYHWHAVVNLGHRPVGLVLNSAEAERKQADKPTQRPDHSEAIDLAYWNAIKDSNDPSVIQSYIDKFPNGQFVFLATVRLRVIEQTVHAKEKQKKEAEREAALAAEEKARQKAAEKIKAQAKRLRAQELAAWEVVQGTNDVGALERFLAKFLTGSFAAKARERMSAIKRTRLAALQSAPNTDPVEDLEPSDDQASKRELVLSIQKQLVRLGCNPGRPDGAWGRKSRSAVQAFSRSTKKRVAGLGPTKQLLASLTRHKGRACPLVCGKRQVAKGNRCVTKTCPKRQKLSTNGNCVAIKDPKREKPNKRNDKKPEPKNKRAGSGRCGLCAAQSRLKYRVCDVGGGRVRLHYGNQRYIMRKNRLACDF